MARNYPGSLHNHTEYSNIRLRDSINKVDTLIDYAIELGHECVAITDHECISSFVKVEKYYNKVKEKHPNFKVIRGNEIYLTRNGLNGQNFNKSRGDGYYHFILLAKDIEGYKQICQISTNAWMRSYKSGEMIRVPSYYSDLKEIVAPNKGHLIATTACIGGQFPKFLLKYRETGDNDYLDTAKRWALYMVDIFGAGNFYFEMQPSDNEEQIYVNKKIVELSKELNIPYIISTDSHYLKKSEATIHDSFLKAKDGDREVASFYATTYLMGTEELESFFSYFDETVLDEAYKNIINIKNSCTDFSIMRPLRIPYLPWYNRVVDKKDYEFYVKQIPSLEKFKNSKYSADNQLVHNVIYGIKHHPDLDNKKAYEALEECLDMTWVSSQVNNAQWSAYYLNLQRIIDECWNAGSIVGPARGSGGGFVLLYCLDIIQVNALRETTKCFPWRLTQRV